MEEKQKGSSAFGINSEADNLKNEEGRKKRKLSSRRQDSSKNIVTKRDEPVLKLKKNNILKQEKGNKGSSKTHGKLLFISFYLYLMP